MITRGMPGHRLGYRRADRLSVQLHLIRDPCMPAKYQETRDQKNCQDDQPEVAPPASILGEAIPKFQRAHHQSLARGSAVGDPTDKYASGSDT